MGIRIEKRHANAVLKRAVDRARSNETLPEEWTNFSREVFGHEHKTYVAALGTALLARAGDDHADPLSIKESYASDTYSQRQLGHGVLVPAAREYGFSLRTTGREPLNNQPFYRYDHMTLIDRVRDKPWLEMFVTRLQTLVDYSSDEASDALAAFVRVATAVTDAIPVYELAPGELRLHEVLLAVTKFLDDAPETPKRAQALAAAAFDVVYPDVRTRKLNDPSRDFPGDVQVYGEDGPFLAVEVRTKPMPMTELDAFAEACRNAGIDRAFAVVFLIGQQWHDQLPLSSRSARHVALKKYGVLLGVVQHPTDLVCAVIGLAPDATGPAVVKFAQSTLTRLVEIECQPETLEHWTELISLSRAT